MLPVIDVFSVLERNKYVFALIPSDFSDELKRKIYSKYGTLKDYSETIGMERHAFGWAFRKKKGNNLKRLVKICLDVGIKKELLFSKLLGFYPYGSRKPSFVKLNRFIEIDSFFVEGYALYVAEGDTGYSGRNRSRKMRLTNSEPNVINFFSDWIENFFPGIGYYVVAFMPEKEGYEDTTALICQPLKISSGRYNHKVKYRVCLDSSVIIDLMLDIRNEVRNACLGNKNLAAGYLRGLMAGEGTVYNNRTAYVRLEMKNPSEIEFARKLLDILDIKYNYHARKERPGMESIYIGGRENIRKYYILVGFGCEITRQAKLATLVQASRQSA